MALRRVVFALASQIKARAMIKSRTKVKESTQKEKARKKLIFNPDFQPLKHLKEKEKAMLGNLMTGLPVSGLMILGLQLLDGIVRQPTLLGWRYPLVLDLGCTRSIRSRSATESFHGKKSTVKQLLSIPEYVIRKNQSRDPGHVSQCVK